MCFPTTESMQSEYCIDGKIVDLQGPKKAGKDQNLKKKKVISTFQELFVNDYWGNSRAVFQDFEIVQYIEFLTVREDFT